MGKLDIVFANAGVAKFAPFGTITEEFYDSIFNINVKGLLFTVQKALPLLSDGASVILNASKVDLRNCSAKCFRQRDQKPLATGNLRFRIP
jgi:NAD(P)-dependent dehydrogenase (short-subunit alcohol dehydrogenase family)